mmetsp:Transcript_11416/g.34654  ORF Transcript_11416/g.34654 Transcript_11416/m.34654 type:complete len:152 (-) Transcript_11416:338-793(-)
MDILGKLGNRSPAPPAGTKTSVNYSRVPMEEQSNYAGTGAGIEMGDNASFVAGQRQVKQQHMQDQEEQLSELAKSANRLGDLSLIISGEISEQNRMLDDVEKDLDRASDLMDALRSKTKKLIEKSGGFSWFSLIIVLSIIMVVLFMLVIYT